MPPSVFIHNSHNQQVILVKCLKKDRWFENSRFALGIQCRCRPRSMSGSCRLLILLYHPPHARFVLDNNNIIWNNRNHFPPTGAAQQGPTRNQSRTQRERESADLTAFDVSRFGFFLSCWCETLIQWPAPATTTDQCST
jgi:hypothetical protein